MNYFNFKRYNFSTIIKKINITTLKYSRFVQNINYRKFSLKSTYKYLNIKNFNIFKLYEKINFEKYKYLPLYFFFIFIFFGAIFLNIPAFYKYDKSKIEKIICINENTKCSIKGKINYSFYPTPRIKIKNLEIKQKENKKNVLIQSKNVSLKLSMENLLNKKKQNIKQVEFKKYEINLELTKNNNYLDFFNKKNINIPVKFKEGKITFFDNGVYIASINNADINLKKINDFLNLKLNGNFLNDNILVIWETKLKNTEPLTEFKLKMKDINLLVKASFFNTNKENLNIKNGNISIKKKKNKLTAVFDYKDKEFLITKANVRNFFLEGKLVGKIRLRPYTNFNLDLELNSINFTKLYTYFLSQTEEDQKNIFRISDKINGQLNFSSNRIYSNFNLIKSFESRLNFNNGNISIEQFLINLGKLGAADILGTINNDKELTNFKYETNIFIENQKKFLSKFGIYNKKKIPSNLFISGNFDLFNIKNTLYEISGDEKVNENDVNYIEKEFNQIMLEEDYESLFLFSKFKEFVKAITSEN